MGWFDNDKQKERADAPARPEVRPQQERPAPEPRPAAPPGSTLGAGVHVDGTIVSKEDLTVVGRIEGTIRAGQTLRIAEDARIDAVIHGRRVLVQGTVTGDVHGTETVVLGPTASVTGNIQTPSLEIHDGALFKGEVDMESARKAAAERAEKAEAETEKAEKVEAASPAAEAAESAPGAESEEADASGDTPEGESEGDGPDEGSSERTRETTTPAAARTTEAATSS